MVASAVRYRIRGATRDDVEALHALARELDTVNLPDNREHLERLLSHAEKSFSAELPLRQRKYVFLLWDHEKDSVVGTSTVVAQLGRRGAPYIYFDVFGDEKYAATVDPHFHPQLMRVEFSY